MQAIERINLPKPDTHCFDDDSKSDVWSYSRELVIRTVLAHIDKLEAEIERLRKDAELMKKGLEAVEELIDQSSGVAGLHLNGDIASWSELRTGGRFEAWLLAFDDGREAAMKGTP